MASGSKRVQNEEVEREDSTICVEQPKKRIFKTYIDYLAAPNPRRLYSPSQTEAELGVVPRAALRAKASKRIRHLALPRSLPSILHFWASGTSVEPAALKFKITERLTELSTPSPRLIEACLKEYGWMLTGYQKETLEERIREGKELSRRIRDKYYIQEEFPELDRGTSSYSLVSKTSKISKGSQRKDWDHQQRIEILAQPVFHSPPPILRRGRKIPLPKLMRRIKFLSKLPPRDVGAHRAKVWKFTDAMKNYKASDRLNEISKPRIRPNIHVNLDPKVSEAAKNFQATERMKILAIPKRKAQEPDTELRENPFSVSPLALQAKCTPRLKELAMPVNRDVKNK